MTQVKCGDTYCYNNENGVCCLEEIEISEVDCDGYTVKSCDSYEQPDIWNGFDHKPKPPNPKFKNSKP